MHNRYGRIFKDRIVFRVPIYEVILFLSSVDATNNVKDLQLRSYESAKFDLSALSIHS